MQLYVSETTVNRTTGSVIGVTEITPTDMNLSELYRAYWLQYGKSQKMYVNDITPKQVGWVFSKRAPYDDSPTEMFMREVWLSVYTMVDGTPKYLDFEQAKKDNRHQYYLKNKSK